jgi:hypothetical protein
VFVNSPHTDFLGYHPEDDGELPQGFEIYQGTGATTTTTGTTTLTPIPASTPSYGSVSMSSDPSGAKIYLDNEDIGLTPLNMNTITNGNHVVIIKRNGYRDWTQNVAVLGNSTSISATLIAATTATTVLTTTVTTTKPTSVTTVRTTVSTTETTAPVIITTPGSTRSPTSKAPVKIPTPWPTDTPPEPSPLGIELGIIATMGAALPFLKRK